jgi:hypothetical protein
VISASGEVVARDALYEKIPVIVGDQEDEVGSKRTDTGRPSVKTDNMLRARFSRSHRII